MLLILPDRVWYLSSLLYKLTHMPDGFHFYASSDSRWRKRAVKYHLTNALLFYLFRVEHLLPLGNSGICNQIHSV